MITLIAHNEICGSCGHAFTTWHATHDYEYAFFATLASEYGLIYPDDDPHWSTIARLVYAAAKQRGLNVVQRDRLLEAAFGAAIGRSPAGQIWYMWSRVPCPRCGSLQRERSGPIDVPTRKVIEPISLAFEVWASLADKERDALIQREAEAAAR